MLAAYNVSIHCAVTKLIDAGRLPHLLFYGPPGTGKTSTIKAIAKKLYGGGFGQMVLEVSFPHCCHK